MFFLTSIDPRAAIKGSRDPLGLQPVWTRFGRAVVGNLTTVTTSLRNFNTLLLGLYFAEEQIATGRASEDDRCNLFLKFEQLAGYSRVAHGMGGADEGRILGITRIRKRLNERDEIVLSARQRHQILSAQKTYGLWGLYTVAARNSGLVEDESSVLTPRALDFVQNHDLSRLSYPGNEYGRKILAFLDADDRPFYPTGRDEALARGLARLLEAPLDRQEQEHYSRSLILGVDEDHTGGRQQRFWERLRSVNGGGAFRWDRDLDLREVVEIQRRSRAEGDGELAQSLEEIHHVEPLLAVSARAFGFALRRHGSLLADVVGDLRDHWGPGLEHLDVEGLVGVKPKIEEAVGGPAAETLLEMARSLREGRYGEFLRSAIALNTLVMKRRGGAPWVVVEKGRLDVRLREEGARLPDREELPWLWDNSYFLNALKTAGSSLVRAEAG